MIESFKTSPLLLLFVVSAIGYWLGTVSIRGIKLGVAAVLFVGLGFGALDPELNVPDVIIVLGLSIFVYTVGLSSGPGFVATFREQGLRNALFVTLSLFASAGLTIGLHFWFGLDPATTAGLMAGSNTNTPALAGLLDLINNTQSGGQRTALGNAAVVGYSLSYPMGVLGVMFAIELMHRLLKVDDRRELMELRKTYAIAGDLSRSSIEITDPEAVGLKLREVFHRFHKQIVFGRMKRNEQQFLPNMDTRLEAGDQIVLVGYHGPLQEAIKLLGKPLDRQLSYDRTIYDAQRIFVSNPALAGSTIAALNLPEDYSAIITRVKRGDIDILAKGSTVLELGDRILLVGRREELDKMAEFFGNSYESLSQINLLSFGLGMALGLMLGMVTFQFPGEVNFSLGFAGGPLIVALVLGYLRRTGPIVWTLPYSANLTLRQIGLILLLAGIGIRSGHTFLYTVLQGGGGWLFLAGGIVAVFTALVSLWIGYKLLKIPFTILTGMVANQPAILDYAIDKAGNSLPNIGFTFVLPFALIVKILVVQLMFLLL